MVLCFNMVRTYSQYNKRPKYIWFRTYHNTTKDQKSYGFAHTTMQQRTKRATVSHIPQYNKVPKELRFRTYHNTTMNQKSHGFAHITIQQWTKRTTVSHISQCNKEPKGLRFHSQQLNKLIFYLQVKNIVLSERKGWN